MLVLTEEDIDVFSSSRRCGTNRAAEWYRHFMCEGHALVLYRGELLFMERKNYSVDLRRAADSKPIRKFSNIIMFSFPVMRRTLIQRTLKPNEFYK